ncbi:PREDICTED: PR domain zinc finger protein 13-like [Branchiostoma belcheri]|uniref:PR domain zinc finger protein 13-like n=1 Tax=Branchiostoma belcheri TaxID=7741 RepID=A0A6P4YGE7_BRABE|nr:PREDICTED: PR domain zinc finger protein 13-like [Branchiostoma belcheri]XP_019623515.1 PREDICTED: PR domain zinc finger protein 13-like [Branchiostoma belcheri]XP_019623516.1 PREDICTED: PR domain zinc finger protein 13-like [Branchiostoma belcheri]
MSTPEPDTSVPGRRSSPGGRQEGKSPRTETSDPVRGHTARKDTSGPVRAHSGHVRAHTPPRDGSDPIRAYTAHKDTSDPIRAHSGPIRAQTPGKDGSGPKRAHTPLRKDTSGLVQAHTPRKEAAIPVRAQTLSPPRDPSGPARTHTPPSPPVITPVAPPFSTPGYPFPLFPGCRPDGLLQPAPILPAQPPHGAAFLLGREKAFAPLPAGGRSASHFDAAFPRYGLFERCLCPSLAQTPQDWLLKPGADSARQYYYGLLEKDRFMSGLKPPGGSAYPGGLLSTPVPSISPYRPALPSFFLGKDAFNTTHAAPYPFRYPTLVEDALRKPAGALIDESPTSSSIQLTLKTASNKTRKGHLCIYCGKLYSRKYGLKIHLRTHTGYKPLKCKVCLRPFGDPSNLNKHIRLHAEGETPYRCPHCGKVLVRRRDLERHVKSRHPDAAAEHPKKPEDGPERPRLRPTATSDGASDADAISDHDDADVSDN